MNKSDLVSAIADNSGLSKADAARALEATTSAITGALAKGDSVAITGFGSFLVRARAARSVVTHKQVLQFKLKLQMHQHLKQVNY